ncbi:MAG: cupin domain-containing protein, partial [Azospirillaceae bacterium]
MATEPRSPLGALAPADFLARHWQRAPLLVRDALPDLGGLLTPDDLAGIACDPEALARLVIRTKDSWEVRHGPFEEDEFGRLPRRGWSLLVSCVDAWVPALAAVTRRFGFLPAWRFDDCMVSYAPEGGGVGPHVDQYDVFLVQLAGRRRWSVGGPAGGFRPGLPLRILEAFAPTERWDLGPGDMLYLPPGTAHDGVSLDDDCLTLSIGFRAPSAADLLATLAQGLAEREDARFADAGRAPAEHRLAITEADLDRTQALLRSAVEDRDAVADALARLVTEPRL